MYKNKTIAVVVPAYNEAGFVGTVIETIPDFVDRIYAVDDCSTDGTWAEITKQSAIQNGRYQPVAVATTDGGVDTQDRVVAVQHDQNRGVGAGIITGYRMAVEDDMDVVAVMNADEQMDPEMLDRIVDPVVEGRADYAKGNRLRKPEYRESMSGFRLFGNTVLTFLTKVASGYWGMMDPQNGYTAISREAIQTLDLDALYQSYGFCNDMLVRLNVHRFRVADVEMPAIYGEETSNIEYSTFVPELSALLARQFLWRLRTRHFDDGFHPAATLYGLGGVGLLTGVRRGFSSLKNAENRAENGRNAVFKLLLGALLLVFGVAFDRRDSEDLEVRE